MTAVGRVGKRVDWFLREGFGNEDSALFHSINRVIVALIFVSVASVVLASVPGIYAEYKPLFDASEAVIVAIFTAEYLINIYVAADRKRYIFGPWGIIDLLAVLPSILLFLDLRALKVGRVLRILRFLRMVRVLRVLKLAKTAVRQQRESRERRFKTLKLDLQIYLIALFSAVTILSTLEFYAEAEVANTSFTSIPAAMWWCMVTLTTTGYGDMCPSTIVGRAIAAITMLTGLALFAMLMNVIGKTMLASLFGASDLESHEHAVQRTVVPPIDGEGTGWTARGSARAASSAPLGHSWPFCPQCGAVVGPDPASVAGQLGGEREIASSSPGDEGGWKVARGVAAVDGDT
jgi:voltage-gated potassium channel